MRARALLIALLIALKSFTVMSVAGIGAGVSLFSM